MILVAIFVPPLAVLMVGKPFQALINCFLTLFFYFPGMIHAVIVVNNHNADKRQKAAIEAQRQATEAQTAALIAAQRAAQVQPVTIAPPAAPVPAFEACSAHRHFGCSPPPESASPND